VYKITGNFLDEQRLRIVAAIGTVTPQMLENTWTAMEYRLGIYVPGKARMLKLFSILQF
jgi:hypothetical protein